MSALLRPGLTATLSFVVGEADTALAVGSGALQVLGTPRLIAWMEAATCAVVADVLDPGRTSVGTHIDVTHSAPSPTGTAVEVVAALDAVEGRTLVFAVSASSAGAVVGHGEIRRAVVDTERFLGRIGAV